MATFAKLDENNIVINISKVDDKNCLDENGDESEAVGIAYLQSIHGGGNYKQTSFNTYQGSHRTGKTVSRGHYAAIGGRYDEALDQFIPPLEPEKASWTWDSAAAKYVPPVPNPDPTGLYQWKEDEGKWKLTDAETGAWIDD